MSFSVEQAFVGRDEKQAPLKTPAWGAKVSAASLLLARIHARLTHCECVSRAEIINSLRLALSEEQNAR